MPKDNPKDNPCAEDAIIINEAQLVLAEKRTSLSAIRTGIAVFALPISVLGLLVATSKYYDIAQVLPFLIPLVIISLFLALLGGYLIVRAVMRILRYDRLLHKLKSRHSRIAEFLD